MWVEYGQSRQVEIIRSPSTITLAHALYIHAHTRTHTHIIHTCTHTHVNLKMLLSRIPITLHSRLPLSTCTPGALLLVSGGHYRCHTVEHRCPRCKKTAILMIEEVTGIVNMTHGSLQQKYFIHASALNHCVHQLFPQCSGVRAAVNVVELNAKIRLDNAKMEGFADRCIVTSPHHRINSWLI